MSKTRAGYKIKLTRGQKFFRRGLPLILLAVLLGSAAVGASIPIQGIHPDCTSAHVVEDASGHLTKEC